MPLDSRKRLILIFLCVWLGAVLIWAIAILGGRDLIRSYFLRQPETYRFRVEALLKKNDTEKALREALRATQAYPYDFEAHDLLANILYRRGEKDEAYAVLGRLEKASHAMTYRRGLVIGYDPGRIYSQMAQWDFAAGRIEQGVHHLLRVIDESPIYISNPPHGFPKLVEFLGERLKKAKSGEELILYCRVLDAMGAKDTAAQILDQVAGANARMVAPVRLIQAEMKLLDTWFTKDDTDLLQRTREAKALIDTALSSNPDHLARLRGTLLVGYDRTPAQPLPDSVLDPLIGDQVSVVIKPRNLEFIPDNSASNEIPKAEISFNVYNPGAARSKFSLDSPAKSICLIARGTNAMAVWPYVIIRLDGREIARRYIRHFAYLPYIIPVEVEPGEHTVEIQFLNDEYEKRHQSDTNLYLRALVLMPQ